MSDKKAIVLFVLPAFLVFLMIVIVPIFFSAYYSTLEWNGIGKSTFIGIQNYIDLFVNNTDGFMMAVKNSFLVAFFSVFVQVPLALVLAIVISKGIKGEAFFRTVYFIPVIISTTVIGQLWMKIYQPKYGMLNTLLEVLGLEFLKRNWLATPETALGSALFVIIWQYIGYHMLLLYSGIKAIPTDLYEAAEVDGANNFQKAVKITIPLIAPMIKVCVTFALIGSLKTFDLIYVLTKGGPIHATEVPTTLMFSKIFLQNKYGYGSAMSIFIILECLIFTIFIQKFFKTEKTTY
ncbi:carbohydrate ABC transporter permease [Cellulosilyticum sp. I15G10I2]|uniref:carbohydrate ABC transporter permease n=1 Tax=Cellulosilyticum sp. I15G10I2 TaxID=1892843 RepID=UPI002E8E072C|nr:sugar ABC transporter permease [Cellulosilyticum sp. I15G10I2]